LTVPDPKALHPAAKIGAGNARGGPVRRRGCDAHPRRRREHTFEHGTKRSWTGGISSAAAEAKRAAGRLGLHAQFLDLRRIGDPARLFAAATRGRAGAALALQARLPAIYAHPEFVRRGGLAT
jgi:hypothetical protein